MDKSTSFFKVHEKIDSFSGPQRFHNATLRSEHHQRHEYQNISIFSNQILISIQITIPVITKEKKSIIFITNWYK